MVLVSAVVAVYYNVILAWVTHFFFSAMTSPLPWASCNNTWNTPGIFPFPFNPH
jgi:SNF family Na+-dependent transporter